MTETRTYQGGCLCGAVRYRVTGTLSDIWACHCSQCRKTSGHQYATTQTRAADVAIDDRGGLKWFDSSEWAQRGFCQICGSSLFWRMKTGEEISIMAGTLEGETGLRLAGHIFTADKGDYYDIPAHETQIAGMPKLDWRDGDPGGT